jgi:hypothetical protein
MYVVSSGNFKEKNSAGKTEWGEASQSVELSKTAGEQSEQALYKR